MITEAWDEGEPVKKGNPGKWIMIPVAAVRARGGAEVTPLWHRALSSDPPSHPQALVDPGQQHQPSQSSEHPDALSLPWECGRHPEVVGCLTAALVHSRGDLFSFGLRLNSIKQRGMCNYQGPVSLRQSNCAVQVRTYT